MKNFLIPAAVAAGILSVSAYVHAQQSASVTFAQPGAVAAVDFNSAPVVSRPADAGEIKAKKKTKKPADIEKEAAKKKARLEAHPEAAIKKTPAPEIDLPGVMKIAGEDANALDFTRSRIVEVNNSGSKTIWLSSSAPNRIQLPWANTRLVGAEALIVDKKKTSNNVYIQFKPEAKDFPVQVFFEDPNSNVVLGAQLVPKEIPGQTILVRDTTQGGRNTANKNNTYVTQIQSLMEVVALGGSPNGYSEIVPTIPPIVMNGLVINTEKIFSSGSNDIYVYDVANPAPTDVMLREPEFDGPNVLAVSIFPKPLLKPNEHVKVIVEASRKGQ